MGSEARKTAVSFVVPGGAVVLATMVMLWAGVLPGYASPVVEFYLYAVLIAGGLLAWRFHSSRALYGLVSLLLADQLVAWAGSRSLPVRVTNTALDLVAILLPLNVVAVASWRERGLNVISLVPKLALLVAQVATVGVLCRPEQVVDMRWLRSSPLPAVLLAWTHLPQFVLVVMLAALSALAVLWLRKRRPLEAAWFWSLAASAMALRVALTPPLATYYFAAAALVLTVALVENSYALAYHDELTGIPGRRAFNEAVGELAEPYAIAMVDVDHFKKFNDTYGHDIGDQVLRMVAGRLARVTGGGRAYRCGGEEFAVVFPGKAVEEALPHLETLRQAIEQTEFMVRGPDRSRRRRPERRQQGQQRRAKSAQQVTVTVSVGAAQSGARLENAGDVIRAADQALYAAKDGGRNRVEQWPLRAARAVPTARAPQRARPVAPQ